MSTEQKIRVGWFSFTCCEDSTIMFAEILNKHYKEWLPRLEFVHARIFRRDVGPEIEQMDIAFIEGAISSDRQEEKLKKVREKATTLVAIGACAVNGSPSNQRNFFDPERIREITPILERFKYKEKVMKVSEIVKVDASVPGCPMNEDAFLELMNQQLNAYS